MQIKNNNKLLPLIVLISAFSVTTSFAEKIIIQEEDRACEKDEDCIGIETDCERGGCECPGVPVNIKFEEKYKKLLEECRKGRLHTICEALCQAGSIECVENKCTFVKQEVNI